MDWKTRTLLIGGVIGLLTGLAGGYIIVQRAEATSHTPKITAGDGVKVGLSVLGLLRLVSEFAERD
ncbi:MAG TPA: hypothetical protein VFF68_02595 [Anaerolineaceae bacterium]|nr:hypothetical protein [Anaerolineaceae bacterium]